MANALIIHYISLFCQFSEYGSLKPENFAGAKDIDTAIFMVRFNCIELIFAYSYGFIDHVHRQIKNEPRDRSLIRTNKKICKSIHIIDYIEYLLLLQKPFFIIICSTVHVCQCCFLS